MKTLGRAVTTAAVAAAALGFGVGWCIGCRRWSVVRVGRAHRGLHRHPGHDHTAISARRRIRVFCDSSGRGHESHPPTASQDRVLVGAGSHNHQSPHQRDAGPNYLVTYNCNQVLQGSGNPKGTDSSNEGSPIAVSLVKPLPGLFNFGSS